MATRKALGYDEKDGLYKEVLVSELLQANIPMNILLTANKIILDDQAVREHPLTTEAVKQYLLDLKLLGKFDFKALEKWVKKLVPFYRKAHKLEPEKDEEEQPYE